MFLKYLIVFIISMIPLIELRGAIPYAVGFNLPLLPSYLIAIVGNMLPVPIIFFFARKVLEWGKDVKFAPFAKFCRFCIEKGEKAKSKLLSDSSKGVYIALLLFVGIPLPGTGAWTGALVSSCLNMKKKPSLLCIVAGVIIAAIIVFLLTYVITANT